jgi:hypothetical protein
MAAQRFVKRFEDRRTESDLAGRVTWALADCTAKAKDAAASAIKHDLFPDIAPAPFRYSRQCKFALKHCRFWNEPQVENLAQALRATGAAY